MTLQRENELWEHLIAYETAAMTTNFQQLLDAGVALPQAHELDDQQLAQKVWEVIEALARVRVFLSETDHLNDRELYELLWRDVLRQEIPDVPLWPTEASHIDLLGSGDERATHLYLKYYADEPEREYWLRDFPDYDMPTHEEPPYDRDSRLPVPDYDLP
jgi:hypothetical protein